MAEQDILDTISPQQRQRVGGAAAIEGSEGAVLWAVSKVDGKKLAERKLEAMPVFDGMVAAGDRVYRATTDGRIFALAGRP